MLGIVLTALLLVCSYECLSKVFEVQIVYYAAKRKSFIGSICVFHKLGLTDLSKYIISN